MSLPSSPTTPTPYYTVVGSSADRVVATDGPEDHNWTNYAGTYYWSYATASSSAGTPKTPKSGGGLVGLGKSLTRKVSNRWRKAGGVVMTEGRGQDDPSSLGSPGIKSAIPLPSAGAATPAVQDSQGFSRRSGSAGPEVPTKSPLQVGKERIKKMRSRYSISISVDPKSADAKTPASPSPATPTPDTPTSIDSVRVPRRLVKPRPSLSSADPSPSRAPSSSTPSSVSRSISTPVSERAGSAKLWKLMKRISTGGLRDKYHSRSTSKSHLPNYSEESLSHTSSIANEPAPPVPALPKGFRSVPVGSSPASPISVSSDGGHSPRTSGIPNTSPDIQIYASQSRIAENHRSASLHAPIPISSSSSSPAGSQKTIFHRLRATSSVGALRRRPSTSSGFSASASANVSEQGLIQSSTPSGRGRPQFPSRPSTANATSSSPDSRFLNTSVIGRSRSMRSKRSSISSVDEINGHLHNPFHPPPPQNQLPNHSQPAQQQSQSNNKFNTNNGMVPVPPMPGNILAKHIVPPGELSKGPGHVSSTSLTTTSSVNKDSEPETRNNEREGSSTGVSTGLTQSGGGNPNASRTCPPPQISGFSRGRPSKVGLYLELPSRSATSPLPRINDLDNKSGNIRIPVPMPSPGRSASLGGFEWSMARSPEYELPSLPVPPRKRASERVERGEYYVGGGAGVDVNGGEKALGRGRSSTSSVASPLSSPTSRVFSTSSPPRTVESPSSLSSSGAGSAEYFSPALSTFGRVVGKQLGMERIEEPSFVSASTPGSASSVSSSIGSGSGSGPAVAMGSSSSIARRKRARRMSISESISHFLSISSSSPRPGGYESPSLASAVARSYSSPSSCSEGPLSPSSQSQPSLPLSSSNPVAPPPPSASTTSTLGSTSAGALGTLFRKLSFSSGASTLPPVRPARHPKRPSASAALKDVKKEENSKTNNSGGANVLRKSSLKRSGSGRGIGNRSAPTNGAGRNGDADDSNHPYSHHRKSISLTEKEKRERWKDLLAKSERAGGTLHLNADGDGLLSDKMSTRASALSLVMGELEFEEQGAAALEA